MFIKLGEEVSPDHLYYVQLKGETMQQTALVFTVWQLLTQFCV